MFVEREVIVQVAAAHVERLAQQLPLQLVLGDCARLGGVGFDVFRLNRLSGQRRFSLWRWRG
jgi:hypothetical protein